MHAFMFRQLAMSVARVVGQQRVNFISGADFYSKVLEHSLPTIPWLRIP
jgi:hypothetical protein